MNKYFILLFLRENTIILPGFGALTAPNNSLEDIMFLPYLKTDDGKLVDFIVETEGIDPQDAQNTVAKFIREMETSLSKGESFDIFNFGSFFKNESGEIEFKSSMTGKNNEEATPVSTKLPEEKNEPVQEEAIEPKVVVTESPKRPDPIETIEPAIKQEEKIVITTQKEDDLKNNENPIPKEKKKSQSLFLIIGVPILLGVAAAIIIMTDPFGMKKGESKENSAIPIKDTISPKQEEKTINLTDQKPEVPVEVPSTEPTKITEPKTKPSAITANASTGFYLIGGVYPSVANAEKKVQRLEKEGLKGEILNEGPSNIYVSLGNFTNKSDASSALFELRNKGVKVWLYEKKK